MKNNLNIPENRTWQTVIVLGFTTILLGYLLVWLPQPIAGLSFTGLEISEWIKFLPEVRAGNIQADRNLFYLPPITLGLMMVFWTIDWQNGRWQTWATRGLAILVSLLAFPAIEAISNEPVSEWGFRLGLVLLVAVVAICSFLFGRSSVDVNRTIKLTAFLILGLIAAILPTWAYFSIRPVVSALFGEPVGIGPGVFLNLGGNLMVAIVGGVLLYLLSQDNRN